ncbi:MAG TPA: hypothetical protein VFK44_02840 [Bacillales bacterium]|nr:hypothetical protein [Bacillales bacterium]
MAHEAVQHLRMIGSGRSGGGNFDKVRIIGEGSVNGELCCVSCKTRGNASFDGNVKAESFHAAGAVETAAHVKADRARVYGELKMGGSLSASHLKLRGALEAADSCRAEKMDAKGHVRAGGDVEAEGLSLKGGFTVGGLLNAEEMDVRLKFPSEAREVGGGRIRIARAFGGSRAVLLEVDTIEGDDVYVEYVKARVVRGNAVRIGPGCEIGTVEHAGRLKADARSHVKQTMKR